MPATFEATGEGSAGRIRGGAGRLIFDNSARIMHMTDDAWLNDGPNAFSGCNLSYDLDQETITSGSSECGEPVIITIQPRSGGTASQSSSSP
jgi:lipopolysaccharide transport protein LptA